MLNKRNEDDSKKVNSVVQLRYMIAMMIQLNVPLQFFFLRKYTLQKIIGEHKEVGRVHSKGFFCVQHIIQGYLRTALVSEKTMQGSNSKDKKALLK